LARYLYNDLIDIFDKCLRLLVWIFYHTDESFLLVALK